MPIASWKEYLAILHLPNKMDVLFAIIFTGGVKPKNLVPNHMGSSWPKDETQVSCIAGRILTIWVMREAPYATSKINDCYNADSVFKNVAIFCWCFIFNSVG